MTTIVDGVEITPNITSVLKEWNDTSYDGEVVPVRYLRYLSTIQDHLTRLLVEMGDMKEDDIKECIGDIIFIKDDIAKFIPEKGVES